MPTNYGYFALDHLHLAPNQKEVKIHKEPTNGKAEENFYATINLNAMRNAAKHLNGRAASAFILWCYLAKNQNGYELALSNAAVNNEFGMKRDAYNSAVQLLIENGFLVQYLKGNKYDFIEYPDAHKIENGEAVKPSTAEPATA